MQTVDWHKRYQEQAQWTKTLRRYLLSNIPIKSNWNVLEFGCGTGAILKEFTAIFKTTVGMDLNLDALTFQADKRAWLLSADAYHPPFKENLFDLIYCHYFLLWLADPNLVIEEVKRLLKPGGYLVVFAEPDFASRQTSPKSLVKLADLQNSSLEAQGVNLNMGRQLGKILVEGSYDLLELGSMKKDGLIPVSFSESEKGILRADWEFLNKTQQTEITKEELEKLLSTKLERWYVPTYYALARVKK